MPTSIAAKQIRRQLLADGVTDPFILLSEALARNEELRRRVEELESICCAVVYKTGISSSSTTPQ